MTQLTELTLDSWRPTLGIDEHVRLREQLEHGQILFMPHLPFVLSNAEQRFLTPDSTDGSAKNISLETNGELKGARGNADELAEMRAMVMRFRDDASALIDQLFPSYAPHLRRARTSLRVHEVEQRVSSYRKDDKRLHVDAFPSRPTHGERILRVFNNINPHGEPRVWRVGEPFEDVARRFLPHISRPFPGAAVLLQALHITKGRRSEYDHIMLQLHDRMKQNENYQRIAPQQRIALPPASTWIVFSDQVSHAAMSGQHMLEQTFHLPVAALHEREATPLGVLERLRGRRLVA